MKDANGQGEYRKGVELITNSEVSTDFEQAVVHFKKALELGCDDFNNDWRGWATLAEHFMENGDQDQARKAYQEVLRLGPEHADLKGGAFSQLSLIAIRNGQPDQAINYADKALEIEELNDAFSCMASYCRAKGLALKAAAKWDSGQYEKTEIVAMIDAALSALQKCKPICGRARPYGAIYEDLYRQINDDAMNLQGLKNNLRGGCFIATAAYDNPLAEPVQRLRHIRDDVLRKTTAGEEFFDKYWEVYYRFSPVMVEMMNEDKEVRDLVRWSFVEPIVAYLTFSERLLRSDTLSQQDAALLLEEFKESLLMWLESMPFITPRLKNRSVVDSIRSILDTRN